MRTLLLVLAGLSSAIGWYCGIDKQGTFKERRSFIGLKDGEPRVVVTDNSKMGYFIVLDTVMASVVFKIDSSGQKGRLVGAGYDSLSRKFQVLKKTFTECDDSTVIEQISKAYLGNIQRAVYSKKAILRKGVTRRMVAQKMDSLYHKKFNSIEDADSAIGTLRRFAFEKGSEG